MKNKILIAVCDDERFMLKIIESKLKKVLSQMKFQDYCIHLFHNGLDLLKSRIQYDLVLLDIEMADIDGLSLAAKLNASENKPLIIFITIHKEFMELGFHVKAYRYLTKPINDNLFAEAVKNAIKEILRFDKILVTDKDKKILLALKNIIYIESLGEGCCIYTGEAEYIRKEPLKFWLSRLPKKDFIQTHRAYIVNLRHIDYLEPDQVCMKNGSKVPVSVRKRKALHDALRVYL